MRVIDVARATGVSKSTILRLTLALKISPKRVGARQARSYTLKQGQRIAAEIKRRRNPPAALES